MPPRFGVVVVNWRNPSDTQACLASLLAADPSPAAVAVVDNGSGDDSVPRIEQWLRGRANGHVRLIQSERNDGFAAGVNTGLRHLATDRTLTHFLVLNNDAQLPAAFFGDAARVLDAEDRDGLLSPTVTDLSGRRVLYAGATLIERRARARAQHGTAVVRGDAVDTGFVAGCAMVITRAAYEQLGPLPEAYFLYMEDVEYSASARERGLAVRWAPDLVVRHAQSATVHTRLDRGADRYWMHRGRVLFARRRLTGVRRGLALIYLLFGAVARAGYLAVTARLEEATATLRGTLAGLRAHPGDHATAQEKERGGVHDRA